MTVSVHFKRFIDLSINSHTSSYKSLQFGFKKAVVSLGPVLKPVLPGKNVSNWLKYFVGEKGSVLCIR